jgi:cell division cycle 2-like protein
MVVTLWYRAPELLLGQRLYSTGVDVWSLGCIMGELLCKDPLFQGKTEIDQIDRIFRVLGTPNEKIWPDFVNLPSVRKIKFPHQPYNNLTKEVPEDLTQRRRHAERLRVRLDEQAPRVRPEPAHDV